MKFDDLFIDMPRYGSLREIKPLKKLFDILSAEESVRRMIEANDIAKRPAICGMIQFIEKFCDRHSNEGLNLDAEKEPGPDGRPVLTERGRKAIFLRRFIGAMINAIMANNGYTLKKGQKIIGGGLSKYFSSGACYRNPSKTAEGRVRGRTGPDGRSIKARHRESGGKETATRPQRAAPAGSRLTLTEAELRHFIAEAFQTAAAASSGAAREKGTREEKFVFKSDGFIVYPFAETVLANSRLHYMSAYQIACEIEINHPGIVEMTGTFFMPEIDEGPASEKNDDDEKSEPRFYYDPFMPFINKRDRSFVELIQDFLVHDCIDGIIAKNSGRDDSREGDRFEIAAFADYFEPEGTVFRNCEYEYFKPGRRLFLFRPRVAAGIERELSLSLSEKVNEIDTRYSSMFFDKFRLDKLIERALENAFDEFRFRSGMPMPMFIHKEFPVFLTLNQLKKKLFDIAERFKFEMPYNFDGYPVYAILLELLKERRLPFGVRFMSSRHLANLSLARYYDIEYDEDESPEESDDEFESPESISELGNYVPLIMARMF